MINGLDVMASMLPQNGFFVRNVPKCNFLINGGKTCDLEQNQYKYLKIFTEICKSSRTIFTE